MVLRGAAAKQVRVVQQSFNDLNALLLLQIPNEHLVVDMFQKCADEHTVLSIVHTGQALLIVLKEVKKLLVGLNLRNLVDDLFALLYSVRHTVLALGGRHLGLNNPVPQFEYLLRS